MESGREKAMRDQKPRQAGGDIRKSISGAGGGGEASCVPLPPHTPLISAAMACRLIAGALAPPSLRGRAVAWPGGWRRQARQQAGEARASHAATGRRGGKGGGG